MRKLSSLLFALRHYKQWVVLECFVDPCWVSDNNWRYCGDGITFYMKDAGIYDNMEQATHYILTHHYTTEYDNERKYTYRLLAFPCILAWLMVK